MGSQERLEAVKNLRGYTDSQKKAFLLRGVDLLVTAGAGSGKTRTLVAKYLALLAEGYSPQQIVAVTFTEKAAREMRNRVRTDLVSLGGQQKFGEDDLNYWNSLLDQIEGARIGTIHSLCAEIIRSFPAEAGIDPGFEVLEEGISAMFKNEAVQMALVKATQNHELVSVFEFVDLRELTGIFSSLLDKRLESHLVNDIEGDKILKAALKSILSRPKIEYLIRELEEFITTGTLVDDAGERMGQRIENFVRSWQFIRSKVSDWPLVESASSLFNLRKMGMNMVGGKRTSQAKLIFREMREFYDELLNPWVGGADKNDLSPSIEIEGEYREFLMLIGKLFVQVQNNYRELLAQQRTLDFDDLEFHAHHLLSNPEICEKLKQEVKFVLVDEFQDTNQRQRDILMAIAGERNGCLFMVGDAQQSIYRFRGADVEIFVEMKTSVEDRGGDNLILETTFRGHKQLVDNLDELLMPVLGNHENPDRPFAVPYSQMMAAKIKYDGRYDSPFIEVLLGFGEDGETGRVIAAVSLADRLIEMRNRGEIKTWNEVALLFRASSGYAYYEDAFAGTGIPYLTVAGRGFYDRPEIRDFLNVVKCVGNPWNDTTLVGFLRSPTIGFTDVDLLKLVASNSDSDPLYNVLRNQSSIFGGDEYNRTVFALQVLDEFSPLVNRLTISELMERIVVFLNYRAILAEGGNRLVNNLDKLLEDARQSKLIHLSEYLAYIKSARDVGVRTGEAISATQDSVQLMTIHKAKGLEFPLVVLADASYGGSNRPSSVYSMDETVTSVRMSRTERQSLHYDYARWLDRIRGDAEDKRLLYVACTRAREKLFISGHVTPKRNTNGYLKLLGIGIETQNQKPRIDLAPALSNFGESHLVQLGKLGNFLLTVHNSESARHNLWNQESVTTIKGQTKNDLYLPIRIPETLMSVDAEEESSRYDQREWRATKVRFAPAVVVGKLVHKSIQRWVFPGEDNFGNLVQSGLIREGIVDPIQQKLVINETELFLERFKAHDIFARLEAAEKRKHEVPYSVKLQNGKIDTGVIDLLFKNADGWHIIDFKTDQICEEKDLADAVSKYQNQLMRYKRACTLLLGMDVKSSLVLLDVDGSIVVLEI